MLLFKHIKKQLPILLILVMMFSTIPVQAASMKKPKIKKITVTNHSANLNLKKNNSSCSLKIYRSTKKDRGYRLIAKTKKTTFKDKNLAQNKTYYYKVCAYKKTSKGTVTSKYSKPIKIKTKKTTNTSGNSNKVPGNTTNNANSNKPATANNLELEKQVLNLVNQERAKNGLSALSMSDGLQKAAAARAKEIVQVFSHSRPDGSSYFTILKEFGVSYKTCGENIAYGYNTAASVVDAWMNSPGHRANILKPSFGKLGVGHYNGHWVQLFTD